MLDTATMQKQLGVSSNCKQHPIHVDRMDMVDSVTYVLVRAYVTVRYHATFPLTNEIICYNICHLVRYDLKGCNLNDLRNTVYNVRLLLTKTA